MMKLVILEKYSISSPYWNNLEKRNKISGISTEQVLHKYQGFEGDAVDMIVVKEDELDQIRILKTCEKFSSYAKYFIVFVISEINSVPQFIENIAVFVGYDIGICEKEGTIYSSIFNEILFGNVFELILCQKKLNEYFLFSDILSAEKYVVLHEKLASQGQDVEDYGKLNIYKIWRYVDLIT